MATISHKKVKGNSKEDVLKTVSDVMELANWKKFVKGKKIFVKPNLLIKTVVPGQCTSPWIVEGIVKILTENGKEVFIGDANVATTKQVEEAAANWGTKDICKKYGATFVNLSKEKTTTIKIDGEIFKELEVPKILTEVDSIITAPVLKTHLISKLTCALKNQWGCIPRTRQQLHQVLDKAIPEINKGLKVSFAVVDATICLEGNGPVNGNPKILDSIFASNDLVSIDSMVTDLTCTERSQVTYLNYAEKIGVGKNKYKIKGDKIEKTRFLPPKMKKNFIVNTEMKLRKVPILNKLIFNTAIFKIPAFLASRYNTVYWYHLQGKKLRKRILSHNKLYKQEFLTQTKDAK